MITLPACQLGICIALPPMVSVQGCGFLILNERYKDKNSRNASAYLKLFECGISG